MSNGADYVIVGGGVYGCAVAAYLSQKGAEVLLLEARKLASGASGGEGRRGIRANGRDLRELPLMRLAYELWPSLEEVTGMSIGYEKCGHLRLIERPRDWNEAMARQRVQQSFGIESELLTREALDDPALSPAILGALHTPNDGVSSQSLTTAAYAALAEKQGVQIREHTPVDHLLSSGHRVTSLVTRQGEGIDVRRGVLLLNNAGVAPLLQKTTGLKLPVWRRYPQAIMITPPKGFHMPRLNGHAHRMLSMKINGESQLMISGGWVGREEAGCVVPDPAQIAGNLAEAKAIYPVLAGCEAESIDVSRAETQCLDQIPIIDRVQENLFFATGWSGHGWAIAPVVATLLTRWLITGGKPPLLEPFALDRFPSLRR